MIPSEECDKLLQEARLHTTIPPEQGLAMKADLCLPWRKLRVMKRWMKSWGANMASEEYSIKKDSAFCYPCSIFGSTSIGTSKPEKAFMSTGFCDWKHAKGCKGKLQCHNNSISHKQALVAWEQFKPLLKLDPLLSNLVKKEMSYYGKNGTTSKQLPRVFALVQFLYAFLSSSKAHVTFVEMQNQLHPQKQTRQLQMLSDTRWACRYLALDVIAFDSVVATLESIAECNDKAKAIEATGLLHQVKTFKFVSCLIIFLRIIRITKALSDQLQKRDIDLAVADDLVFSTADTLKGMRSDTTWKQIYKYMIGVAKLYIIDTELPKRKRRRPNVIKGFVSLESSGRTECLDNSEVFRVNIYFPVLDVMSSEIDHRFTQIPPAKRHLCQCMTSTLIF
uniref:TTF-type domain-containing protein n=1 Tax=Amphimedon queenslandica TaxID=400682 RepID=A0A1X7VEV1_AMPQE